MKNILSFKKTFSTMLGIFLLIALLLECFFFNFRSIESIFFDTNSDFEVTYSDGTEAHSSGTVEISTIDGFSFVIENINQKVNNIMLDITAKGLDVLPITISVIDEGNSVFSSFPEKEIVQNIKSTKFIRLNLAGKAKAIKVDVKNTKGRSVTIKPLVLNAKVPMTLSLGRLLFVWMILSLFYAIRPKSSIYSLDFDEKKKKSVFWAFLTINIIIILMFVNINPAFKNPMWQHHKQYHSLAESLLKGHFYLDAEVPSSLLALENPYDPSHRAWGTYLWDHAYFEGKYYVYFGIVPCLLYYLPCYLLTGVHMPTYVVIFINASLSVLGIMLLLKEILKKKYPDTPYALYLLLCQIMITGGGLWLIAKRPDFYFVPISTAIMLTLFGLYFWLRAINEKKLNSVWLTFGSLFMALVAGSRPQFILGSFFIFIIFYESFKEKKLLTKSSKKETLSIVIPYVLVAAFLMYYNFARFGSPFDFGANYNLTMNDMTLRGIRSDRTVLGWFSYLFQPPNITAKFPFIHPNTIYTAYQGTTITEEMFGGFLFTNPFVLFCCLSFGARKYFEDKKHLLVSLLCLAFALIIAFADTQMAGILTRYVADFGLFLYFGAAITFVAMFKGQKTDEAKNILKTLLIIGFAVTLSYNLLLIFTETGESIRQCNPALYYKVKYLTCFWN
ncbi:MAG: hypothetical protein IKL09_05685 [Clostridia bacterium]|nr:hypothetical protein [Clostridia bacterium]